MGMVTFGHQNETYSACHKAQRRLHNKELDRSTKVVEKPSHNNKCLPIPYLTYGAPKTVRRIKMSEISTVFSSCCYV